MRGNHTYRLLFLVVGISVSSWSLASTALAQRINFSTWTGSEEITINPVLANRIEHKKSLIDVAGLVESIRRSL